MDANRQWRERPSDERYVSMDDLYAAVLKRRNESWTATPPVKELRTVSVNGDLKVNVFDPTHGEERQLGLSNWSFGQLSQYAGAPAAYLRKLHPDLAAINLQYGLEHVPMRDNALILGHSNGDNTLRSMTGTTYGRVWDAQVCKAVKDMNEDGRWVIPAASYATTNPKRATTLYASDRDVFIFLVDPKNPISVAGENLFRGFMTWNSEVGSAVFGLKTFLYRYVCDNRIIWGATNVSEIRIRHTSGAPDRFYYEAQKYLKRYAEEGTAEVVEGVKRAQAKEVPLKKDQTVEDWLFQRGFTKAQAKASVETAEAEEGGSRTLWEIINGVTAYARGVKNSDERVILEAKAGKIMEDVSKN